MAYIVKCPQCNEINIGSAFHCVKCNANLIGTPREKGKSPIPEFISPPPLLENHQNPPVFNSQPTKDLTSKKKIDIKTIIGGVITIIYVLFTFLGLMRMLISDRLDGFGEMCGTVMFYIIGVAIFLIPAENLLRFDRGTGYFLYKMTSNEDAGLGCASVFYILFGLAFMALPLLISIASVFADLPPR